MDAIEEFLDSIIREGLLYEFTPREMFGELLETVKRRKMNFGGVRITVRKMGRPNPMRSMRARMTARRFAGKRRIAMRRYARSSKAKRMRMIVSRYRKSHPKPRSFRPRRRR
jgi:hypothetical protein